MLPSAPDGSPGMVPAALEVISEPELVSSVRADSERVPEPEAFRGQDGGLEQVRLGGVEVGRAEGVELVVARQPGDPAGEVELAAGVNAAARPTALPVARLWATSIAWASPVPPATVEEPASTVTEAEVPIPATAALVVKLPTAAPVWAS